MRVLGLDQSLSSTGVAHMVSDGADPLCCITETWAPKTIGTPRLLELQKLLVDEGIARGIDLLVIEYYAPTSISQALCLGELGGVLKTTAEGAGVKVLVVNSTHRVLWATGSGKVKDSKDLVSMAAARAFPNVFISNNDEADAIWLAHIGMAYLGCAPAGNAVREDILRQLLRTPEQVKADKRTQRREKDDRAAVRVAVRERKEQERLDKIASAEARQAQRNAAVKPIRSTKQKAA